MIDDKEKLKKLADEQPYELNKRSYIFKKMNFKKGIKIISFISKFQNEIDQQNYSFLDDENFKTIIEPSIMNVVLCDGMQISKLTDHWEKFPGDYIPIVIMAFVVYCFPFGVGAS